jgi:hypothetical protein
MVVVRAYLVLTEVVVEITCWHGQEDPGSHLLLREHRPVAGMDFGQVIARIAETVAFASSLLCDGSVALDPRCLDVL